jgi:hypothetical protein
MVIHEIAFSNGGVRRIYLDSVNDLQPSGLQRYNTKLSGLKKLFHHTYLVHQTNITSMNPTFIVNRLLGGLLIWKYQSMSTPTDMVPKCDLLL